VFALYFGMGIVLLLFHLLVLFRIVYSSFSGSGDASCFGGGYD
jgi:Na+-transporting methylmalonyl-CoA/oxaloacetate decarboxylase gamma subunit